MSKNKNNTSGRRDAVLNAALDLAMRDGFSHITRDGVAKQAGVGAGTVNLYYGTVPQLKRDVMRVAIARRILPIIAQGIAARDPRALNAPDELKRAALDSLMRGGAE